MSDNSGPAFPVIGAQETNSGYLPYIEAFGLTKRELFAALAMQGLCSNDTSAMYDKGPCNAAIVARSIVLADALIAALAQERQG